MSLVVQKSNFWSGLILDFRGQPAFRQLETAWRRSRGSNAPAMVVKGATWAAFLVIALDRNRMTSRSVKVASGSTEVP